MAIILSSVASLWARLARRDAAPDRLAGLGPNLCKEAGLSDGASWTR